VNTHLIRLFVVAFALAAAYANATTSAEQLARLAQEARERWLDLSPVSETLSSGAGPRQDKLEITFTDTHRERQRAHARWVLDELAKIPATGLSGSDHITHDMLAYQARESLEWLAQPLHQHYMFIQLNGGVANNLINLVGRQPFRNEADYDAWLRRVQRYPQVFVAAERVMRDGLASGITTPRVLVERALKQLESLAPPPQELHKSSLWKPALQFPGNMTAAPRANFEGAYRRFLTEEMLPAIHRLARFVHDEYLPRARTTDGVGALPNGAAFYRLAAKTSTTTELAPDEIHDLGLREVARIQKQFLATGVRLGFSGPMSAYRQWVEANPAHYPFHSGDEVIAHLNRIHERIVPQMPKLFSRFPKARFEIRLTDPAIAASTPAQWYPPSDDGTRPGTFAMPVVNARRTSMVGLEALLAHEGMPGHHFDGGIRLEANIPEFRRKTFMTAFGEGWGLYAESLGEEIGLYDSPLALLGRYGWELFRACRLVVDTGLHAKSWPRAQAMRYLVDECASSPANAELEVLRYMAWPGQALAYKIGELTIRDLRREAEKQLGARFDLRAFHDTLLAEGHMPLSVLQARMRAWLAAQKAAR
jgi:uncharacterized protein (DUF885 family)